MSTFREELKVIIDEASATHDIADEQWRKGLVYIEIPRSFRIRLSALQEALALYDHVNEKEIVLPKTIPDKPKYLSAFRANWEEEPSSVRGLHELFVGDFYPLSTGQQFEYQKVSFWVWENKRWQLKFNSPNRLIGMADIFASSGIFALSYEDGVDNDFTDLYVAEEFDVDKARASYPEYEQSKQLVSSLPDGSHQIQIRSFKYMEKWTPMPESKVWEYHSWPTAGWCEVQEVTSESLAELRTVRDLFMTSYPGFCGFDLFYDTEVDPLALQIVRKLHDSNCPAPCFR